MMDLQVGTKVAYETASGIKVEGVVVEFGFDEYWKEENVKIEWNAEDYGTWVNEHLEGEFEYMKNFEVVAEPEVAEPEFDRVFVEFMPNYEAGIYKMFEIKRKVKHNEKGAYIQYSYKKYYLHEMELVEDYGDFGCYKCTPKF